MADNKFGLTEEIIVIDDEPSIAEIVAEIVKASGYNCRYYTSPVTALKELGQLKPFLVLSDFRMPEMDGLQVCTEIRKTFPTLPFVMITAFADKELVVAGNAGGMNDLINKPFDAIQIQNVVAKYAKKRSEEIAAEKAETEQIVQLFIEESLTLLGDADQLVLRLEERPIDPVVIDSLFRKIHSVKGGAGAVGGGQLLSTLAHEFESLLAKIKKGEYQPNQDTINTFLAATDFCIKLIQNLSHPENVAATVLEEIQNTITKLKNLKESGGAVVATAAPSVATAKVNETETSSDDDGIWVTNEKLDSFMALSGELIVLKNHFQMISREFDVAADIKKLKKKHAEFAYGLNKITDHLQENIMSVRKVSLEKAFGKLGRIVRQTSIDVGKRVKLKTEGLEMGVDKNIAKSLSASMVHMVRNSIDHGIESPEKRAAANKNPEGTVTIKAYETQGTIFISVIDDGGGIAKEKVIAKAIQNGLLTKEKADQLPENEIFDLIFLPGFSTAEKVTGVSGRGVGMDVVKSSVIAHSGKVKIESKLGQGTKFLIEIPVPKAVMVEQTVLGKWKESVFAVPLTAVARISSCDKLTLSDVEKMRMCQFDGQSVTLRTFDELLNDKDNENRDSVRTKTALFIRHKDRLVGLLVDSIEDQLEAVVRPFDNVVRGIRGFKGTTVLGNEKIAYVVSPEEMVGLSHAR